MRHTEDFLIRLRESDIRLHVENDRLKVDAPKGILTSELVKELKRNKEDIIELLNQFSPIDPIRLVERGSSLPLSFSQERLWFMDILSGDSPIYNMPAVIHLKEKPNREALEKSFNKIVQRHESFRTTFHALDGQPVQNIVSVAPFKINRIDLQHLTGVGLDKAVKKSITKETRFQFDLREAPLLRASLIQLSPDKQILIIVMHHIISDGWSMGVFVNELVKLYGAYLNRIELDLPELPIQYADFSQWERQQLTPKKIAYYLDFWKAHLENAPDLLQIPTDFPRPPTRRFRGDFEKFRLDMEFISQFKKICSQKQTTLYMALISALAILLKYHTGQESFVIGSLVANRARKELEPLIGFFVNTLPLHIDISGNPTYYQLLERVKKVLLDAYKHQNLPLGVLIQKLQPKRDASCFPLFQILFGLDNTPDNTPMDLFQFKDITVNDLESEFDLSLRMREVRNGIASVIQYNTDLFKAGTIKRMIDHFQNILKEIVSDPNKKISELSILTPYEKRQTLTDWNKTNDPSPKNTCIHQLFEEQVEKSPHAVAIEFQGDRLTYDELNQKANQLARYVQKYSVEPENIVGVFVHCPPKSIVALLAILKAGAAYLPLDPNYSQEKLSEIIRDAKIETILTQEKSSLNLPKNSTRWVLLDKDQKIIDKEPADNLPLLATASNLAYVAFTSGSIMGKPKGVMIGHQAICHLTKETTRAFSIIPKSRILQSVPLGYPISTSDIFVALCSGATLCLAKKEDMTPGRNLYQTLWQLKITCVTLAPGALRSMPDEPLPDLKTLVVTGDLCPDGLRSKWAKGRKFISAYGVAEYTAYAAISKPLKPTDPTHIGKPIGNTRLYILDEHKRPTPIGVPGELYVGGVGLARGYVNRPDLTNKKFVPDPFTEKMNEKSDRKLFKTGDVACYRADGFIEFLGRLDRQIKIKDYQIETKRIESILDSYRLIKKSIVIAAEKSDDKHIVAYLMPDPESSLDIHALHYDLQNDLPGYMVPSTYLMINKIPLTPDGKIYRKGLPKPDLIQKKSDVPENSVTELEKNLAQIWEDTLGIHPIGIENNFFDLGGYSLLLVRLLDVIKHRMGYVISISNFLRHATIKDLAFYIERKKR
ncbi:MAG: hypothetical protein B6244_08885 [Candidatus Cloacimonetes bacterium 4572_55]|nr:MAG: hypothetical protein B6244_08885 [Candidatus Cloacimonetes bacterium 4572_55]